MLTEEGISTAIEERLQKLVTSCNSGFINSTKDVVRGLLWALRGEDPGPYYFERVGAAKVYELAGMPVREVGKHFYYARPWKDDVEVELQKRCEFCEEEGL